MAAPPDGVDGFLCDVVLAVRNGVFYLRKDFHREEGKNAKKNFLGLTSRLSLLRGSVLFEIMEQNSVELTLRAEFFLLHRS
jgi:hypothetical protein